MSESTLWLGNVRRFASVPMPRLPMNVPAPGYSERMEFENGGQSVVGSSASAKSFAFVYPIDEVASLHHLRRLKQGSFGTDLVHFADAMQYETNLFPAHWAEPGLIETDWPSVYDADPTFANTAANSYDQPLRSAVFTITQAANTAPSYQSSRCIIPIPPDMTLHLGVSGSATGTGVVYATGYNIAAGSSSGGALTLITPTSSTRLNATYAGSSYDYVAIDLRRTSSAASTITIASMLARLYRTGTSPTLTGNHTPGMGHTGLMMRGWDDSYQVHGAQGVAFSLDEVGAWRTS